jgi:hypothetical protein
MPDIQGFNEYYLSCFRSDAVKNSRFAGNKYIADEDLVAAVANLTDVEIHRLASSECTLVKQQASMGHLPGQFAPHSCEIQSSFISHTLPSATQINHLQELNFQYLMLVRFLAVQNIREAVMRTGATRELAQEISKLSQDNIRSIVTTLPRLIFQCHLTPKAIHVATSPDFQLYSYIPILSMRGEQSCHL